MRVLIAEDHADIAAFIKQGLERQGYEVDIAPTGREALEWAKSIEFDILILDIILPEVDGLTVCRCLRSQENSVAILILTARDSVDDRVKGLDAGADDYLVKPFHLPELLARLRALTRRRLTKTTVLQVADLSLDTNTQVVMRKQTLIKLTNKEYAVLECLIREPNRVLTRSEIAELVWHYDAYSESNVINVYIRNLRRKIDDPFDQKLIHTVRGSGYCLSEQDRSA